MLSFKFGRSDSKWAWEIGSAGFGGWGLGWKVWGLGLGLL